MKQLDLSNCKTNKEVTTAITSRVLETTLDQLKVKLAKDFVFQEETIKTVYTALALGKNAILHGPGGFGKSKIVEAICEALGLPTIYKIGHKDMSAEELLGVPNMKKLLEESTYEVAFEKSVFAKPGILILEEFLDCNSATAAALKDILSARGLREGSEKKESMIASVIITGNKDPDDLAEDDSTGAFYNERFPYQHKVQWKEYTESNYLEFFSVYFKRKYRDNFSKFRLLATLCENTADLVSPRIAAEGGDAMITLGVDFIGTVKGIDTSELERWSRETELESRLYDEKTILDNFEGFLGKLTSSQYEPLTLISHYVQLDSLKDKLDTLTFSDENIPQLKTLHTVISNMKSINNEHFKFSLDTAPFDKKLDELISGKYEEDTIDNNTEELPISLNL